MPERREDDKILITCWACSSQYEVPAGAAGRKGKCANCGVTIQIGREPVVQPRPADAPAHVGTGSEGSHVTPAQEQEAHWPSPAAPRPQPTQYPVAGQKSSGLAIAALVLGILGILPLLGLLLGIIGIILGIIVLGRRLPGRGLAIGGIVVGVLTLIPALAFLCALSGGFESRGSSGGGATAEAIRRVSNDPRVKEALGEPVEPVSTRSDLIITARADGTMEQKFGFVVRGPKGMAEAHVTLQKGSINSQYSVKEITVYCPSPYGRIHITGSSEPPEAIFIGLGVAMAVLWVVSIVLGIKAARRKGVSPHWMWFGLHPLGAFIACPIIMWGVKPRVCAKCGTPVPKGVTCCSSCQAALFPPVMAMPTTSRDTIFNP